MREQHRSIPTCLADWPWLFLFVIAEARWTENWWHARMNVRSLLCEYRVMHGIDPDFPPCSPPKLQPSRTCVEDRVISSLALLQRPWEWYRLYIALLGIPLWMLVLLWEGYFAGIQEYGLYQHLRKWHSLLHTTMLPVGPLTNRKGPLCKGLFLWALPRSNILSQMEGLYILPLVCMLDGCIHNSLLNIGVLKPNNQMEHTMPI